MKGALKGLPPVIASPAAIASPSASKSTSKSIATNSSSFQAQKGGKECPTSSDGHNTPIKEEGFRQGDTGKQGKEQLDGVHDEMESGKLVSTMINKEIGNTQTETLTKDLFEVLQTKWHRGEMV